MTDEDLQSSWPDLGAVVIELRRVEPSLADRLVNAVQFASTSGEIYSAVGNALYEKRALRKKLSPSGVEAWQRVMAAAGRAFGRPPFREWLAAEWKRICLLAAAFIGMVGCAAAWFLLMMRIGEAPRVPTTEQTIAYLRHGETVYLTPLDDALLSWLPSAGLFLGVAIFALSVWIKIASAGSAT